MLVSLSVLVIYVYISHGSLHLTTRVTYLDIDASLMMVGLPICYHQ